MKVSVIMVICGIFVLCRSSCNCPFDRKIKRSIPRFFEHPLSRIAIDELRQPFVRRILSPKSLFDDFLMLSDFLDIFPSHRDFLSFDPLALKKEDNAPQKKKCVYNPSKQAKIDHEPRKKSPEPVNSGRFEPKTKVTEPVIERRSEPDIYKVEENDENEIYIIEDEEFYNDLYDDEDDILDDEEDNETNKRESFFQSKYVPKKGEVRIEFEKYKDESSKVLIEKEKRVIGERVMEIEKRDGLEIVRRYWNIDSAEDFDAEWKEIGFRDSNVDFLSQNE